MRSPLMPEFADLSCPSSRLTGPPIFISGCNRGGTTILTRLLSAHPEVCDIGRGPFDEGQYIWRQKFPDFSRHRWAVKPWRWFMRRTEAHATPERVEFFRRSFTEALKTEGRLLEKTPANAVRIPFIDRVFPDCHFVHIIRDGRDTTASLMARRVALLYAPHQWVGAHSTALPDLQALPESRVTLVRYDELIADPHAVLRHISTRTGLAWDDKARTAIRHAAGSMLQDPENRWAALPRWKRQYILSVIEPLQKELGYPAEL